MSAMWSDPTHESKSRTLMFKLITSLTPSVGKIVNLYGLNKL
jgi:hypothetical protein